jgi:hypothetical protein
MKFSWCWRESQSEERVLCVSLFFSGVELWRGFELTDHHLQDVWRFDLTAEVDLLQAVLLV